MPYWTIMHFFFCYLTFCTLEYLRVTVLLLLLSQYLFFDNKMSLTIFEKWTTYICFLKKLKIAKTSSWDYKKGRRREEPMKGEKKMKHWCNSQMFCPVLLRLETPSFSCQLWNILLVKLLWNFWKYIFQPFWAKARN